MESTRECRAPFSSIRKKIPVGSMFLYTTCINFSWDTMKAATAVRREAEMSSSFSREKKLRSFLDEELNKPMKVIC